MDTFVYKDHKKLRCGYTTGTCAALAAQGAARFLLTGGWREQEVIRTPKGIEVSVPVEEKSFGDGWASCAVRKDAGDDFDVTDGFLVYARVELLKGTINTCSSSKDPAMEQILIEGGRGIGRVTKPGLDQPVGAAAINSVPRKMIRDAVYALLEETGEEGRLLVTISIPEGIEAAKKTFNPLLGIEGGISVLGRSGIVEPMSEEALVDTIKTHMNVLKAEGKKWVIAVPGNMGAGFLRDYLLREEKAQRREPAETIEQEIDVWMKSLVTMSNFVGKTIDFAAELGFSGILIAGHMGKLVKIGNGIMNTHSREADGRMDTLLSCALSAGVEDLALLKAIRQSNTTDEAMEHLKEAGVLKTTISVFLERAEFYLEHRAKNEIKTGMMVFGTRGEYLGVTKDAVSILKESRKESGGNLS